MNQTGHPGFDVSRVIAGSLALGAAIFWIVGWLVTGGGREGLSPGVISSDVALWIVVGALAVGLAGALFFRGRALAPIEDAARSHRALGKEEVGALSTNLMIAWTLIEAPALVSGMLFLLTGELQILAVAVPVWAAGIALTFPRAEWFGPGAREGHETGHRR